jgi:dihydroorotase
MALRAGLADGTINIVATDHAPHPTESKDCEWSAAAFGMIGLETALSVVAEAMIKTGLMNWPTLVQRMSTTPATIAGYSEHGSISLGRMANFIVVDLDASWQVDKAQTFSRSSNTPFHGLTLPVSIIHTFYRGVHVLSNGQLTGLKYE